MLPEPLPTVPLWLVTGFLGSGKTTLLRDWMCEPEFEGTAVVINELGAIGLDHELVEAVDAEPVLIENGCVCCTVRSNLADALVRLVDRPAFEGGARPRRIVVETTGLADPTPILDMLFKHPDVRRTVVLDKVITVVDALNAPAHLLAHPECARQIAVADTLVLTKAESSSFNQVARLRQTLSALNPGAAILDKTQGLAELAEVMRASAPMHDKPEPWAAARSMHTCGDGLSSPCGIGCRPVADHTHGIRTWSFCFDGPLDWPEVSDWLATVSYFHGSSILRMKGILHLSDDVVPIAIHGVHRSIDPPKPLPHWRGGHAVSRVVFITQDLAFAEALEPPAHWPRARHDATYQTAKPIAFPVPASVL